MLFQQHTCQSFQLFMSYLLILLSALVHLLQVFCLVEIVCFEGCVRAFYTIITCICSLFLHIVLSCHRQQPGAIHEFHHVLVHGVGLVLECLNQHMLIHGDGWQIDDISLGQEVDCQLNWLVYLLKDFTLFGNLLFESEDLRHIQWIVLQIFDGYYLVPIRLAQLVTLEDGLTVFFELGQDSLLLERCKNYLIFLHRLLY